MLVGTLLPSPNPYTLVMSGTRNAAVAYPTAIAPPPSQAATAATATAAAAAPGGPPLHTVFQWRLDKDEKVAVHRAAEDNLVRLVGSRTVVWEGDGEGVPWGEEAGPE